MGLMVTATARRCAPLLRLTLVVATLLACLGCAQPATGPTETTTFDEFVAALRARGLAVSVGGSTSARENGYFSVPSRDVRMGEARLKAFEYDALANANRDASLVSREGQPNPTARIGWISAPHFFRRGRLIVLYVGCDQVVLRTLAEVLGPAFVDGTGCD